MYPKITISAFRFFFACVFLSISLINIQAQDQDVLNQTVRITENKGAIYDLLKDISKQVGYFFIYDSQIIDNNKKVKIPKGSYSLREAIHLITKNEQLQINLSGDYMLLRLADENLPEMVQEDFSVPHEHLTISGYLIDEEDEKGIAFASVSILNTSTGIIANQEGGFQLVIPDSLQAGKVKFSHIGYESREIDIQLLKDQMIELRLKPQVIPLQEIVISIVDPVQELNEMLGNRKNNYISEPVYLMAFYREGINHNNRNIDLTESVLQIYKTDYHKNARSDQVKLIKKRRLKNTQDTDTIFPQIRSGVQSCLILDIIKELPDFIVPNDESQYTYFYQGKSMIDNKPVNIISFRQKSYIIEPLYTGELFIEAESKALVEVRFEINNEFVSKATLLFIDKISGGLKIDLQQAKYIVSYKLSDDGRYYINHVRGDIRFKVRQKKRLFSTPLDFWFEMVTCDINTENAKTFPRRERLSTSRIFAETKHEYDKTFWENFNIILPEEELEEEILRNLNKILIVED